MAKGTRVCVECGRTCWASEERNWREAEALGTDGRGVLDNPGGDAWDSALEKRGIEGDGLLCGHCLLDIHGLAWSIRQREENLYLKQVRRQQAQKKGATSAGAVPPAS